MEKEISITVRDVSKCFKIYNKPQDRLKQGLMRNKRKYYEEYWALDHISFDVYKGETVGIIGKNGSGKSTLLQMIAGTLHPTSGQIKVNGKVAALLELGSGFNPEFTGRENIYMNASILGLNRKEVDQLYNEIVDFADIGDFIDKPVKSYSSGMAVRLAFAVQAMIPKEVLIVDEALAVGDELFQRKCFLKIEEFKKSGGTILFVSHSGAAIVELCDRAVLLHAGHQLIVGNSKRVVNLYQKLVFAPAEKSETIIQEIRAIDQADNNGTNEFRSDLQASAEISETDEEETVHIEAMYDPHLKSQEVVTYESRGAKIEKPEIVNLEGNKVNLLISNQRYIYRYYVRFYKACEDVRFGMLIKTASGFEIGGAQSAPLGHGKKAVKEGEVIKVEFSFTPRLAHGTYFMNAGVMGVEQQSDVYLDRKIDFYVFKILPENKPFMTSLVDFNIDPEYTIVETENK